MSSRDRLKPLSSSSSSSGHRFPWPQDHSGTLDMHDIRNLSSGNRWKAAIHAVRLTNRIRRIKDAALGLTPADLPAEAASGDPAAKKD